MDMINELLSRLDKVKPRGKDKYIAACPAHDDSDPSLTIMLEGQGKILLHCFAGCHAIDIIQSVGLDMCDLFPDCGVNEFQGFVNLQREIATKKLNKEATESDQYRTVLKLAETMRSNSETLTAKELNTEKEAFLKIREIESSENINGR